MTENNLFRIRLNESNKWSKTEKISLIEMRIFCLGVSGKLLSLISPTVKNNLAALAGKIQYTAPSVHDIAHLGACPGDFFDVGKVRGFAIQ